MARNLGTSVRNSAIEKLAHVIFEPGAIRTRSKAKTLLNQPHLQNSSAQARTERRIISFKTQREALQNKVVGKKIADVGCVPVAVAASSFKPSMSKPPLPKNKEQVLVPRAVQTSCYDGQKVAKAQAQAQAQASTKVGVGNGTLQANANANAKQPTLNSSLKVQTNSLPPSKERFTNAFQQGMPHRDSGNEGFMEGLGRPCPPSDIVPPSKLKSVAHMKKNQNKVKPDDGCPPAPRKCKARSRLEHVLDSTKSFQEKAHSVRHGHQAMEDGSESWTEFSTPEKQMVSYHHISSPQAPVKGELLSHFDGLEVSPSLCKTLSFDDNVSLNAIICAPGLKMVTGVDQNIRKVTVSQGQIVQKSFLPVKKGINSSLTDPWKQRKNLKDTKIYLNPYILLNHFWMMVKQLCQHQFQKQAELWKHIVARLFQICTFTSCSAERIFGRFVKAYCKGWKLFSIMGKGIKMRCSRMHFLTFHKK